MTEISPFTAADLLNVWEAGRNSTALDRAVMLLLLAFTDHSPATVESLTLGQKDSLLLRLREALFGTNLESKAICPTCSETLEFILTGQELGVFDYPALPETVTLTHKLYSLTMRLPTIADVRLADGLGERLFSQIMLQASHKGNPIDPDALPDSIKTLAAERIQTADPLIEVRLSLTCPACAHQWQIPLNIISFLWQEIDHWAQRTLYTVHLLARAYGWREQDILMMSAWRRQYYLELLNL